MIKKRIIFSILTTLIFTSNFLHAMDPALHQRPSDKLIIETGDGKRFDADRSLCMRSNTIKNFLEDFEDQEASKKEAGKESGLIPEVPLPGLTGQDWESAYELLKHNTNLNNFLENDYGSRNYYFHGNDMDQQSLRKFSRQLRIFNYLDMSLDWRQRDAAKDIMIKNIVRCLVSDESCKNFLTNPDFIKNMGLDKKMPRMLLEYLKRELITYALENRHFSCSLDPSSCYKGNKDTLFIIKQKPQKIDLSEELKKCNYPGVRLERLLFLISFSNMINKSTPLDLSVYPRFLDDFDQLDSSVKSSLLSSGVVKWPWYRRFCYAFPNIVRQLWNKRKGTIIFMALGIGGGRMLHKYQPDLIRLMIEMCKKKALLTFRR